MKTVTISPHLDMLTILYHLHVTYPRRSMLVEKKNIHLRPIHLIPHAGGWG